MSAESVTYTYHEDGVHQFSFSEPTREATFEYIEQFLNLQNEVPEGATFRVLLDMRVSGMLPFKAVLSSITSSQVRQDVRQRIAYLYVDNSVPFMIRNAMAISRLPITREFFEGDQENAAIAWLLET